MSRYHGRMGAEGSARTIRDQKRLEAEVRDEELPSDSPKRKRNKGTIIVAPPVTLTLTAEMSG